MSCAWIDCVNEADYVVRDLAIKPPRSPSKINVGDIKLCGGHYTISKRLGRIVLDWDRVLRAMDGWYDDEECIDCD
jgi:hypothetical protein